MDLAKKVHRVCLQHAVEKSIRRTAHEMKHHSMGEEGNHLPEDVLNRVANEMWSETSKDCPGGGIGSEGVRGRQEFRWTATGPEARKKMEAWIHHPKDETREEDQSYEAKVEQAGSSIRIKSRTPGRSWIIDRETGTVELSGVWDATEHSKGRANQRRQADDFERLFGREPFLGQTNDEDKAGAATPKTVVTIISKSLTEMQTFSQRVKSGMSPQASKCLSTRARGRE